MIRLAGFAQLYGLRERLAHEGEVTQNVILSAGHDAKLGRK
jgi:hypothetical protein